MSSKEFLEFYKNNKNILTFGNLRPVKSITRNIISGVLPFINWYSINSLDLLDYATIANRILKVDINSAKSTVEDNIKNMLELKFLDKIPGEKKFQFTRNFVDFFNSKVNLKDYIVSELKEIKSIAQISMLYNYILSILREGLLNSVIVNYPDSFRVFCEIYPDQNERKIICENVFNLYGFSGLKGNRNFDGYTPNIIYRCVSTCVQLGLIVKIKGNNSKLDYFKLTSKGIEILNIIGENLLENNQKNDLNEKLLESAPISERKLIIEEIYDGIYAKESEEIHSSQISEEIITDLPKPIPNQETKDQFLFKRDARKAAIAKRVAEYKCEFNPKHFTFKSSNERHSYVEAHHLIPMSMQIKFYYSLDIEANLVALCPLCHSQVHRAIKEEKYIILKTLYEKRKERLKKCNILIEFDDLINEYK
jgi:hypothetical protein